MGIGCIAVGLVLLLFAALGVGNPLPVCDTCASGSVGYTAAERGCFWPKSGSLATCTRRIRISPRPPMTGACALSNLAL